jgi:ABC-type sugar transport system ATPase subunit
MTSAAVGVSAPPVIEVTGIEKHYLGVAALSGVDFRIARGECVGLVGDNGAGKSTLLKILSGAVRPDAGRMLLDGEPVEFHSPQLARQAGVEMVYQDLALAGALDATTNVFLGRELLKPNFLGKLGFVDRKRMRDRSRELMLELSGTVRSLNVPVHSLSGGQRQSVAIARGIAWGQRVLLLDEPMAALGISQTDRVVQLVERLRSRGDLGIAIISHDLPRVFEIADRLVVLRLGRVAKERLTSEVSMEEIVAAITGASL